jgi:hypothetical protein
MKAFATVLVLAGLTAIPAIAAAATFKDVPVIDVKCSQAYQSKLASHPRTCALACKGSGYGVWVDHGQKYLKFDAAGNKMIVKELQKSNEKDNLRVNVSGKVQGDTLKVTSVHLL